LGGAIHFRNVEAASDILLKLAERNLLTIAITGRGEIQFIAPYARPSANVDKVDAYQETIATRADLSIEQIAEPDFYACCSRLGWLALIPFHHFFCGDLCPTPSSERCRQVLSERVSELRFGGAASGCCEREDTN